MTPLEKRLRERFLFPGLEYKYSKTGKTKLLTTVEDMVRFIEKELTPPSPDGGTE